MFLFDWIVEKLFCNGMFQYLLARKIRHEIDEWEYRNNIEKFNKSPEGQKYYENIMNNLRDWADKQNSLNK